MHAINNTRKKKICILKENQAFNHETAKYSVLCNLPNYEGIGKY